METPLDQRATRLAELCGFDEDVRQEVLTLLGAHDAAGGFTDGWFTKCAWPSNMLIGIVSFTATSSRQTFTTDGSTHDFPDITHRSPLLLHIQRHVYFHDFATDLVGRCCKLCGLPVSKNHDIVRPEVFQCQYTGETGITRTAIH
jgi:hypothetical protein